MSRCGKAASCMDHHVLSVRLQTQHCVTAVVAIREHSSSGSSRAAGVAGISQFLLVAAAAEASRRLGAVDSTAAGT